MTHFYLTLPSNSSEQYFPDNTMTEFTTKLASTIDLTGEWEVGLAEIMFPRSWYTIPKKGLKIQVESALWFNEEYTAYGQERSQREPIDINIKGGYYNTVDELVREINQAAARAFAHAKLYPNDPVSPPVFEYKRNARKVFITMTSQMGIEFPPELETILGLAPEQNPLYNSSGDISKIGGHYTCDLQSGIHALYVYCDVLQFTHVGDIKAPLLRVVDSEGGTGDVVTRYYERPRYIPLQKKNFEAIQIVIRDDLGEKIQFESGKVLLTLHFRRAYNKYLL